MGPDESSQNAVERVLVDVGKRLFRRPASTEGLLNLLQKTESLLAKVGQQPPMSTRRAMAPAMKALITNELLHHEDVNVQVALASCFNELTRITAPDFTYEDDIMRVVFQLFMVAFKQLSCESGRNYYRALQIVETMAKVRSSMMLLDVANDCLVIEMFQLFLENIKFHQHPELFEYMEMIMTLVIEESDEISFELLRALLSSVKMCNKDTSPISWELGKKVFENCSTKIQHYLREAVKSKNLELNDYTEIVASICHDTSNERNMVSKEVALKGGDGLSKNVLGNCAPKTNDDAISNLDDENPMETSKSGHRIMHPGTDGGALRMRRGKKLNSVIRPEEGHEHTWKRGGKYPHEASPDGYNEEKEDMPLPSDLGNSNMMTYSSQRKVDSFNKGSLHKKGQPKKKESTINQHNDLEISSASKRKILKPKERDDSAAKKRGKRATAGSGNMRMEKEEGDLGDTSKELYGRKKWEDDADTVGTPMSKPPKAKSHRKEMDKKPKKPRVEHGHELVNLRIQVWWPMDEVFYAGFVKAFDPETKKHTILYDDNETEILNLRKETWEVLGDEKPLEKQEANHSSPPREPIKSKEKNTKRKAATLKKQHAASPSQRSRDENSSISKSREIPSAGPTHHVDGSDGTGSVHILEDVTKV